jgi:hypothetical protein
MFSIGQHVRAEWTDGQLYGARIVNFDGVAAYEVAWDDGSPNLWLAPSQIHGDHLQLGAPVTAQWTDGQWYGARIVNTNGAVYEVAWDDGSPNLWLGPHQIVARAPQHGIGSHVTAQWTNGQWYGARILAFNGMAYEVAWDDGSPNLWVAPHQIQAGAPQATAGAAFVGSSGAGMSVGSALFSESASDDDGPWEIGTHVMAQWTDGAMYGATIVNYDGASAYEVAWDDGSPNLWVTESQIDG